MKTRCRNCRILIPFGNTYCEKCYSANLKEKKDGLKDKQAEKVSKSGTWKIVREKIIARDNGVCVLCLKRGYIQHKSLQVHHLIKRTSDISLAYDPSNLVTVCRTCHEEIEELPVKEQRVLLGDFNGKNKLILKEEGWRI